MSPAKIAWEGCSRLTVRLAGTAWPAGKKEHLPVCSRGTRRFRLARHHRAMMLSGCGGSTQEVSSPHPIANTAGLISEKLNRAISRIAEMRCIAMSLPSIRDLFQ